MANNNVKEENSSDNPRSMQNMHKAQVKPKSQEKDVKIEITEKGNTNYKSKTSQLI